MEFEAARRQAAELILQDERLTAGLEDAEAEVLLRWALVAAERRLGNLRQAGLALDRETVAREVQPVRAIARAINDLTADAAALERSVLLARLLALCDAAGELASGARAPPA
ncbi:MAG: hypothetical protein ACUVX9_18255 [Anaerolineae bacterium]